MVPQNLFMHHSEEISFYRIIVAAFLCSVYLESYWWRYLEYHLMDNIPDQRYSIYEILVT